MGIEGRRIRVLHPITRLIIGGAQENTMLTADYHSHDAQFNGRYEVDIVCGPQTGPEGSLIDEVRQRGIALTILPELRREINPAQDVRAISKLRRLMQASQQPRYQIVHTHSSKAGVLGRIAARLAKVPIIVHTVHGWSFHDQMSPVRRQLYVALEKLGSRFSQATIVVSPHDIGKGLAHGIGRPSDYHLIRSGIELDRFGQPQVIKAEMRQRLRIPAEDPNCVERAALYLAAGELIEDFPEITDYS